MLELKQITYLGLFLALALTIPFESLAAPVVSAASGSFVQGGTVTVSGGGFGTGNTSIMLWDDFEDGTNGNNLKASPKVGTWVLNSKPTPQYSTAHAHSGSKSSYGQASGTDLATHFGVPSSGNMPDTYYYISFWFKYSGTFPVDGQTKLIQLWGTYKGGDYNPGIFSGGFAGMAEWGSYIALENSGSYLQEYFSSDIVPQGVWHLCEMILKQSTVNTSDGRVTINIDGRNVYNKNPVKTREINGQSWQRMWYFYGYTNHPSGAMYVALDDVYMNNSWARVVLGNQPTYSSCTKFDIQPVDWFSPTWADSEIKVKFNAGAYANGSTAYLYVVDANGIVSTPGYPVTIGASGQPPSAPTGVRIVQ